MEETPTWPPDYSAWPQSPTQAPSQVMPQAPQLAPNQYQVPPVVTTQTGVPFSPPQVLPQARPQAGTLSTPQAQIWRTPVMVHQDAK